MPVPVPIIIAAKRFAGQRERAVLFVGSGLRAVRDKSYSAAGRAKKAVAGHVNIVYHIAMNKPCNLCGGAEIRVLESSPDGVRAVRCAACGLVRLDPPPDLSAVPQHYDEGYFRPWIEEQSSPRGRLWKKRLALLESHRKTGRLLDVGCADGAFLSAAKASGWTVTGTEVSDWAVKNIPAKLGAEVKAGDIASVDLPDGSFDAITMWHVLEHTPDPLADLRRIRALLKDDGVFIMAVPNERNMIFRTLYPLARGRFLRYYTPGERELHLFHFTAATLRAMLEKAGFKVLRIGLDRSALSGAHRAIEALSGAVMALGGPNWGDALEAVAVRK
jgi:2-polyprenyl-3-methyl-5-hydroxy-6-metoxy-1,4-benzoquinol methylase